ncbi:hypothetical protein COCSUDRAFT_57113 [Coccomyxa subellipsoidea C-169]|uniref:Uncharacterized protein n=1 Tax=Coccomyxa subellipsoidea (strain C-169) TaxID=574566 RepID=I0YS32_COCSC|nr:hypothetical protein COCSUDRAFT_57113 [Coccomyxa subellipsoidea C-169]EIE21201.1 hypothetical protein COCSUDRAFT_57113 [Coccomyxa subellipsoidea C-169]|eukprot:XP_005645745.1 hypothetical protein COCSUDRAFT_57113 [Coccomyxa subellipsoidea C-169]
MQCREETFVQGFKESRKAADAARKLESKLADSDESMSLAQDLHLWTHQKLVLAVKLYRVMRSEMEAALSNQAVVIESHLACLQDCQILEFKLQQQEQAFSEQYGQLAQAARDAVDAKDAELATAHQSLQDATWHAETLRMQLQQHLADTPARAWQ